MAITFDDITLAFIGAIMGLVVTLPVTYLIVDRIVERNARKELEPVRMVAKDRLTSKLGVGFLTTFLITMIIDVTRAFDEKRPLERELAESYVTKLKGVQSDLEMLLGVYNRVLAVDVEHLTGSVISSLEHLQEDFAFLAETYPKPPSGTHILHIRSVILQTVRETKQLLEKLGADEVQIDALEKWLTEASRKSALRTREERLQVSGGHTV